MKTAIVLLASFIGAVAMGAAEIGKKAPNIELMGSDGKMHSLATEGKGKIVVLEWFNPDCPYVKKHYGSGNMQNLQTQARAKGVVWYTIASTAPGKQGALTVPEAEKIRGEKKMVNTALLLDPKGKTGRDYDAKTTPHMFVIDANGDLAYAGAIDDNSSADPATVAGAKNYVSQALTELSEKKTVSVKSMKPYGCSVKYE